MAAFATVIGLAASCGDDGGTSSGTGDASEQHGAGDAPELPEDAAHVEVEARSFAFEPEEITATAGDEVAVVLTSLDSEHDFVVDELDLHIHAEAGETATGVFRPTQPGSFTIYCSIAGHREAGMEGTLVVEA